MHRLLVIAVLAVAAAFGLVTPAMAAHVSCGDVITQDTVLDSDLVDCPGNGVEIGADGVAVDLAGHTIDGQGSGYGIAAMRTAAARNGTVREFSEGVHLESAEGALERLLVADNQSAGVNCSFGGFPGPHVFTGVEVRGSDTGVRAHGCALRFERSSIHDNRQDGMFIGFAILELTNSEIFANGGFGAVLSSATARITNSSIQGNVRSGLLHAVGVATLTGNSIRSNGEHGVDIEFGVASTLDANRVVRNAGIGIRLDEDGSHIARRNTVNRNGADGILVEPLAQFELTGNRADRNGDDGIDVDDPNGTLARNRADRNVDLGIEAVPGVNDGGGNRAKQNGNRLQCVNVTCRR